MKKTTKRAFAIAGVLALGLTAVKAQTDGALIDALVKKGVLSDKEAEDIRASAAKEYSQTPGAKLAIPGYVNKLTIYGDVRYRFEYAQEKGQGSSNSPSALTTAPALQNNNGENIAERNRYRLRVGADYVFTDNFKAGVELETSNNNDTANQTLGDNYGKANIGVGLVYLQWKPVDWLTLTGGKQRNPLYTTNLMWDPDINPEGASEALSWTFPIGDSSAPARDPKDMKAVLAPAASDMSLTIGLTAFQGIYADNNEFNSPFAFTGTSSTSGTTPQNASDVWQFVEQVPIQFNFDKNTFIKVVPGFDTYTSGGNLGPGNASGNSTATENGAGSENFIAINAADHLALVTAPGEFDWKLWDQPFRFYWDFTANLDGKQRVQDVYLMTTPGAPVSAAQLAANQGVQNQNRDLGDNIAWLAGLQVGQNKKKGDWSIKSDFRQVGLGANDPNLQDSDWGDSFLNQQGITVGSTYNFTDFLTGTVTFFDTWAYKKNLFVNENTSGVQAGNQANVTGTTAGLLGLAAASQVQRVDVDLQWKF